MKNLFKSLRSRIILCILLSGFIITFLLHIVVVNSYEYNLINQRKIEIKQRLGIISSELGQTESISDALTPEMTDVLNWYSEAYGGRLLIVDPLYHIVLDTYSADLGRICVSDAVFSAFLGNEYDQYREDSNFLEFVVPVTFSENDAKVVTGALVFSSTTEWIRSSLDQVERSMRLIEAIVLSVFVLITIYIGYLIVRPVQAVSDEIERLNEGNLDVKLENIDSYTEVNRITTDAAQMIRSYQELEQSQEQFVSNVSHELRTPMTSIRVLADSLVGQENLPEEVYQEFLSDISVEIDREARIIEDLLSMTRLGKASDKMNLANVNINDFVMSILKTIRPIAEERNIELIYESFRQVNADIDEVKLNLALSNLIENGVKYNNEGGFVKVSLDADHEYFYVRVEDNGVGIPEDAIEHVFDRFYRVDKARSRETGGTGLGLSITRQIILLHYGVIKVESKLGEGTAFTVRIPLKHVEKARTGRS